MKKFLYIFFLSNVVFHISWPFRVAWLPLQCHMLAEGILYGLLTWWLLKKYKDDGEPLERILFPLFLGFFWLELPTRILDFYGTISSLLHMFTTPLLISFIVYCFKRKGWKLLFSLTVIWILVVILGEYFWDIEIIPKFYNKV